MEGVKLEYDLTSMDDVVCIEITSESPPPSKRKLPPPQIDDPYSDLYINHCLFPVHEKTSYRLHEDYNLKKKKGETFWTLDAFPYVSMEEYLDQFYQQYISHFNQIAVDGPTACGKSSLIEYLNPQKVNSFFDLNKGNGYNIISEYALIYIKINELLTKHDGLAVDRSIVSNIAYLMAYYVMNVLVNNMTFNKSLHGICREFVSLFNLEHMLQHIRSKKFNVFILMDSSFEAFAKRTNKRGIVSGSVSDCVKSLCQEYHTAQIASFSYLANFLNFPCLDLNYVRKFYNVTSDFALFTVNDAMFKKHCSLLPFTGRIDNLTKEQTTVESTIIKQMHSEVINKSKR